MNVVEQMVKPFSDLSVYALQADAAACGSYRVRFPMEFLRRGGARIAIAGANGVGISFQEMAKYDVVLAQRQHDMGVLELMKEMRYLGKTVIFEIDDNVHAVAPNSPAFTAYKPGSDSVHGVQKFMEFADGLFTTSEILASQYAKFNRRSWVLPNFVDFGIRDWESEVERDPRLQGKIVVGWCGSITHQDDDAEIKNVIRPVLEKYPHAIFCIVSAYQIMDKFLKTFDLPPDRVVRLDPTDFESFPKLPAQFDIGLVPVVNTTFNAAKCLSVDTRVSTPSGIVKIGCLRTGDLVWSGEQWVKVLATEEQPHQNGVRITTRLGYSLVMTPEHRILTKGGWVKANNLVVGHILPLSPWAFSDKYVRVPFPLWESHHVKEGRGFDPNMTYSLPEIVIDERWGEFLGFFAGDGSCNGTGIRVSCDGQDIDVIDRVVTLCQSFGLSTTVRTKKTFDGELLRCKDVSASSRKLLDFLEYIGLLGQAPTRESTRKRFPKVPEIMWRSPKSVVASFLRGYFESDGTVHGTTVSATSKDEQLILGVQQLLLGFDITSRVSTSKGRGKYGENTYWHLCLRRCEIDVFADRIGFIGDRKKATLSHIVSKPHSNAYTPMSWEDEIISVEETELSSVDIQVEGEMFIAAGLVSHNSVLKPLEYGARKVPYVASRLAPYVRFHQETNGQGGYIAGSTQEWVDCISKLVEDEDDRKSKSDFIYSHVKENCSGAGNAWRWAAALREAKAIAQFNPEVERKYEISSKPGRNTLCVCGSGKKYKRCCYPAYG